MAQSRTELFNIALDSVGQRANVSDPDEQSREAETCRIWFGPASRAVLRAAHWPAAKAYARLGVLKERDTALAWAADDPEPGWRFAYQQPADCLAPRYLSTYARFVTGVHSNAKAIFAAEEQAILIYTKEQTALHLWDAELYLAVGLTLGAFITMPLQGKPVRASRNLEQANEIIVAARTSAANETTLRYESLPDWITARNFDGTVHSDRYLHPFDTLITMPGGVSVS